MSILTRDRIYFLLKDPHWSFIWWQVNWARISGSGAHIIRVHDVTDIIFDGHNSHRYVELNNIDATDHWYFQLPLPARNYCAEIGIKTGTDFSVIARSNTLFVPRAGPSEDRISGFSGLTRPEYSGGDLVNPENLENPGQLLLVLNTHLPFVRHPEIAHPFEENWLFEAIVESYLPLIGVCEDLIRDKTDFKITLSMSPPLIAMLSDDLLQRRFVGYLEDRIQLSQAEMERLKDEPQLLPLAHSYHQRFVTSQKLIQRRDVISAFRELLDSGSVEIITSSATHAYLPLWELFPRIVRLQIKLGVMQFRNVFGRDPKGFWLPECGFFPGLDALLRDEGIGYFFLDAHGLLNGDPTPKFGTHVPIHCPSGVAAFGRDWKSHDLVWLRDKGYPGDPFYRDFYEDIGFDLDPDYLLPFTHSSYRIPTGIKYLSGSRQIYDPVKALSRCDEHANHFADACQQQVEHLHDALGRKPVVAALFDTEHFGHWWHEGPVWLNLLLRRISRDRPAIKLVTARDYLELNPVNQVVNPSMSSWGYQGYSETWLMGRNHWIYPAVYEMIELLDLLVAANPRPEGLKREALNQYLRELLLAQSSDWAFMMHSESGKTYAEKRVRDHLENMRKLHYQIASDAIDPEWLELIRKQNNIFGKMDILQLYEDQPG